MSRRYAYCYLRDDGKPLIRCPTCRHVLTKPGRINLELAVGGHTFSVSTRLTPAGALVDTEDGAVAVGFHSQTACARCFAPLTDYERCEMEDADGQG